MFQKTKQLFKGLFASLILLGFIYAVTIGDYHIAHYNLLVSTHKKYEKKSKEQQVRINCSKDLYKSMGDHREHYQILAPNSTLTLTPTSSAFELVENLNEMECIWHAPSNRRLIAKNGSYSYSEQVLSANDLILKMENPPLEGHVDRAIFKLANDEPTFTADNFRATLGEL